MNHCLTGSCTNTSAPTLPLCYFWFQHGLSRTRWNWGCANIELLIVPRTLRGLSSCPTQDYKWGFSPRAIYKLLFADCLLSFQLKTQLTETLSKLETEENERQKVAGDLYQVVLDFITLLIWSSYLEATLITRFVLCCFFSPGPAVSWPHSGGALQIDRQ